MNNSRQYTKLLVLAAILLCALALPGAVRAEPIMLNTTITNLGGGLFRYQYSVANTSPFDFSAVSINVIASPNAVQSLVAPAGFNAFFDPGLGQIDFVEDTQNFAAMTTISGFTFNSLFAPSLSTFTALRLDSNGNPITITGTVLAPQAPIPEPATMLLLGTGLAGIALKVRRRKTASATAAR